MHILREESRRPETSSSSFPTALVVVVAVSCLSISHLYCLTQEPFGDACMSVYHDDAIILGPDVGRLHFLLGFSTHSDVDSII